MIFPDAESYARPRRLPEKIDGSDKLAHALVEMDHILGEELPFTM
jgi:hypothetical protein